MTSQDTLTGKRIFEIEKYGAVPEKNVFSTVAIQKAIDACSGSGGGVVKVPKGTFLTGTLTLKSNVELNLAEGAKLIGTGNISDYEELIADGFKHEISPEKTAYALIKAVRAENISITGKGEINGSGPLFYDKEITSAGFFKKPDRPRPRMVMFFRCKNIRFQDTSFIDCPCWTIWFMQCEDIHIERIKVVGDQRMINNDGIDFDGCKNSIIKDSYLKTADDCIVVRAIVRVYDQPASCENFQLSNCTLDSACQGVRVGCPSDGVIQNAKFENFTVTSKQNGIICDHPKRYLAPGSSGSADITNVSFDNVKIECQKFPVKLFVEDGIQLKRLSDFQFSNIDIKSGRPCLIQGNQLTEIKNISFKNVSISTKETETITVQYASGIQSQGLAFKNNPSSPA